MPADDLYRLNALMDEIRALRPLSGGVLRLLALSPRDPALLEKTREVIQSDGALGALILKIANSAAFTGQEIVDTVDRAVMRVGVKMITGTVAQIELQDRVQPEDDEVGCAWVANLLLATLARNLAATAPSSGVAPETAYTYGLLRDVGRPVLARVFRDRLRPIFDSPPRGRAEVIKREREILGLDHATAGRLVGNRWRLPKEITLVMANQRQPADDPCFELVTKVGQLLDISDEVVHVLLLEDLSAKAAEQAASRVFGHPATAKAAAAIGIAENGVVEAAKASCDAVARLKNLHGISPRPRPVASPS
jgi:HD-like signal output (HDOD) protein